ncbi:MAG: hypothetical protein AB9891_21305 [Anaerolineaceae bacterium]
MEDLIASLPVIAGTIIAVAVIFWLTNLSKKQSQQKIIDLASKNRWVYETIQGRLEWGYRLKDKEWVFEAVSRSSEQSLDSGSSNVGHATSWHSPITPSPDRLVYIGERPPGSNTEFGARMIQQAFMLFLGSQAAGMSEVAEGTSALRERYMLMARETRDVKYLLTPNLEHLLVNFQGKAPVIKLDGEGIHLVVEGKRVEKPDEIVSIIRLGEGLLDAQGFSK